MQEFHATTTSTPAREGVTYPEGFVSYHSTPEWAEAKLKRVGRGHEIKSTGRDFPPLMVVRKTPRARSANVA